MFFGPYGLLLLHVNEKAKCLHNIKFGIKNCMCYILSHFKCIILDFKVVLIY